MPTLQQSIAFGPMGLSISSLLIVFAFLMALLVGSLIGRRGKIPVSDTLFTILFIALVGARVVFVWRYWGSYDGILDRLDIRDGGFDPLGGLVAGGVYALWKIWRSPTQRLVLGGALATGGIAWGLTAGSLIMIDQHARPLPDVEMMTREGASISLPMIADSSGQPMVVNLWATWCPPCRREMPVFEEAQQQEESITFVFANQGESLSRIDDFLVGESLELDNVLLDQGNRLGMAAGAHAMPTTLFYDQSGRLIYTHFGELSKATLQQGIDRLH